MTIKECGTFLISYQAQFGNACEDNTLPTTWHRVPRHIHNFIVRICFLRNYIVFQWWGASSSSLASARYPSPLHLPSMQPTQMLWLAAGCCRWHRPRMRKIRKTALRIDSLVLWLVTIITLKSNGSTVRLFQLKRQVNIKCDAFRSDTCSGYSAVLNGDKAIVLSFRCLITLIGIVLPGDPQIFEKVVFVVEFRKLTLFF